MTHFGSKLSELILSEKTYLEKIDYESGISKQKLYSYLKEDGRNPSFDSVDEIAKYFKISPGYFFSNAPVDRYKQIRKLSKLITQLTVLNDNEILVFENFFTAYANKKMTDLNESINILI